MKERKGRMDVEKNPNILGTIGNSGLARASMVENLYRQIKVN